jgi:hypothetical protein
MNPISLFPAYHQSENRVTNYVGLTLKLIYEESPALFQTWLSRLLPEAQGVMVGPEFRQQAKGEQGVADLVIRQAPFSLAVETKLHDWHYSEQLKRHIADLGQHGTRALLALANFEDDHPEKRHEETLKIAQEAKVAVVFVSYEELINSLHALEGMSARLRQIIAEFHAYLDQSGLLPNWKYLLDVVNCGATQDEIKNGAYICPNTGGAYRHHRAKYLGTYYGKRVNSIHEIRALVTVGVGLKPGQVLWNNSTEADTGLIGEALEIVRKCEAWRIQENETKELQVFMLRPGHATNFEKKDAGGMMQSKKYFWNIARQVKAENAEELATRLNNKAWEEFSPKD